MADDDQPDEENTDEAAGAEETDGEAAGDSEELDDDAIAAEWEAAAAEGGGDAADGESPAHGEEAVYEVPVEISAVLGIAQIPVSQLLKMGRGAVLELDRLVGDPVDIYVDKQMVAHGDVVVVDEKLGVTLHDTIKHAPG